MESRCSASYKQVFSYIEANLIQLKPERIHSDYEAALLKALRIVYPSSNLVGCWFHYSQAIRRKLGRNKGRNFFANLKEDKSAYKIYKKLLDLPLLPAKNIPEGFSIIQKEISEKKLDKWFKHIYAYFRRYWIPKVNNYLLVEVSIGKHSVRPNLENKNSDVRSIVQKSFFSDIRFRIRQMS